MSLVGSVLQHVLLSPRRIAVVDDRKSYTYGDIFGGALFVAEKLDQMTSAKTVGLLLPTSGTFPVALLGAWLSGKVAVPYNYLLNKDDLAYVITDSGADTIITVGPMIDFIGGAQALPPGVKVLRLDEMSFKGMPPLRWPPLASSDDLAVILYTSGTSGRPKGVELTHGNLQSNARGGVAHARITRADTFLGVLPQFHSFGLTALTLIPLSVGAKVVYTARFIPRKVVKLIAEHRPEAIMAVPSMYGALLTVKEAEREDFKSVRLAISGGEALPETIASQFRDRFGVQLLEGYGLTETSPVATWSTPYAFRHRSVGTPLPGVEILIVDEQDKPVARGTEGEILIAGPNIMRGYHKMERETASVVQKRRVAGFKNKRWFRTGDLGRVDVDGFLFITGRKKDMLKVAGEMVIPREIEECLAKHPTVKDAAVIGKKDDIRGEVPVAFVETKEGETFDEKSLREWCRENLAAFKVPRDIRHIEALPRNPTGKIMRRELKMD